MTDIINRIERGELLLRRAPVNYYDETEDASQELAEILRLAKLGQLCEIALKDKNFIELMKRVDKPGKTLSLKDLSALVALAEYGQSVTWIPVTERFPTELGNDGLPKPVLCTDGQQTYKAYYVGHRQVNCEDAGYTCETDWDEETDAEYWPEGWYECASEQMDADWVLGAIITHWMLIPELPKERESNG